MLAPNYKESMINLSKYRKVIRSVQRLASKNVAGVYKGYEGQGISNTIDVSNSKAKFRIYFDGYYTGRYALYSGPNMGNFTTYADIQNDQGRINLSKNNEALDCIFDFNFQGGDLTVK